MTFFDKPWYRGWHLAAKIEQDQEESDQETESPRHHLSSNLDAIFKKDFVQIISKNVDLSDIKNDSLPKIVFK